MTKDELLLYVSEQLNQRADDKNIYHIKQIVLQVLNEMLNKDYVSQYEVKSITIDDEDPTKVIVKIK